VLTVSYESYKDHLYLYEIVFVIKSDEFCFQGVLCPRAYVKEGVGVKPPSSMIFYKALLLAQRRLIVFAHFLLVSLST